MAKRQTTESKLAQLKELRNDPHSSSAYAQLRTALADRSNYVAARAAEIIGEFEIRTLAPDLTAAFNRLMIDPSSRTDLKSVPQRDPQCLAKTAIAEALVGAKESQHEKTPGLKSVGEAGGKTGRQSTSAHAIFNSRSPQ